MAKYCDECGNPLSFRNSFVYKGRPVCRDCLARLDPQHKHANVTREALASFEQFTTRLEKQLKSHYIVTLVSNRVEVDQDGIHGAIVRLKYRNGRTIYSKPTGFMPSAGLRFIVIGGVLGLTFVLSLLMGYIMIGIGAIPLVAIILLMRLPSHKLVSEVTAAVQHLRFQFPDEIEGP
jgi:hypothetical protein